MFVFPGDIETGRWSRIPREKRLCTCGAIQTEEHVICFCPLSDHVRSESPSVPFTNITQFFECEDVPRLCYVCRRILSVYE